MTAPFAQYRCALFANRCAELRTPLPHHPPPLRTRRATCSGLTFPSFRFQLLDVTQYQAAFAPLVPSRYRRLPSQSPRVSSLVPFRAGNIRPQVCCSDRATWKFGRKLRECVAVLCSCWRDEIIHAASPPLALALSLALSLPPSLARRPPGKVRRFHGNSAHLWRVN